MTYQQIIKLRPELKEEMEERVCIKVVNANINQKDAEKQTALLMHKKYIIFDQPELF